MHSRNEKDDERPALPEDAARAALARAREDAAGPRETALVTGLTGHRWNRIATTEASALRAALNDLFREITRVAGGLPCTLVTGMAEGADLTAVAALPDDWNLHALLPLPRDAWRAHLALHATGDPAEAVARFDAALARPGTVTETCPPLSDNRPDYATLGRALLARSDLLIAVWNGELSDSGGTGEIAQLGITAGKPVIRLWRSTAGPWRIIAC